MDQEKAIRSFLGVIAMTLQMLFARWLLVGLASLTVLSTSRVALSDPNNPLVRAAQSSPNIRGLKCVAWNGLAHGSKEAYVLGVLSRGSFVRGCDGPLGR